MKKSDMKLRTDNITLTVDTPKYTKFNSPLHFILQDTHYCTQYINETANNKKSYTQIVELIQLT